MATFADEPVSESRQPKLALPFRISESTSAVTVTLRVTPLVVPVVNEPTLDPYESDCAAFHVSDPLHVEPTVVTSIVRDDPGAPVIVTVSVAESAPPVDGMLQLERSNRMNAQFYFPDLGETASV